jgi:membrane-bound lytic murein transglycosylase A
VFATLPDSAAVGPGGIGGTVAGWRAACRALESVPANDHRAARVFFERQFVPYRVMAADETADETGEGLFTGYFEPTLTGARNAGGRFTVPIYALPTDLVDATRAEIANGALAGRGLELVWVDDAVDAFFLHIQGSGRVKLRDGSVLHIGFAGSNGHPYTAIGAVLVARGAIERDDVSMQSIRAWLDANPAAAHGVLATNARYIFFREIPPGAGPIGALGAALTAGRSIAVDRRLLPLGAPVWLDTSYPPVDAPADLPAPARPLQRLMVAQDTGAAIRGAVRGDVFWGFGETAARRAGHMKQRGRYFLLLPKGAGAGGE